MRHSTPPVIILGCGFVTVVFLGLVTWKLSESAPIMKLKPVLEKAYGVHGFGCKLDLKARAIEVRPPDGLPGDRWARRRLGAIALLRYAELCEGRTQIEQAVVAPPPGAAPGAIPREEVSRTDADALALLDALTKDLVARASNAASCAARILVTVGDRGGTLVVVDVGAADEAAARRAGRAVLDAPLVGAVRVVRSGGAPLELNRSPSVPGHVAPVGTRG